MERKCGSKAEKIEKFGSKSPRFVKKQRFLEKESERVRKRSAAPEKRIRNSKKKPKALDLNESPSPELELGETPELEVTPMRHIYPVYIITLAVEQVRLSLSSFRGVQKTFDSLAQVFKITTPVYTSIRNWVLRLGLYELQRKREFREDWIFIIDTTIELGQGKCLMIVGISQEKFREITEKEKRSLQHQDVEVLALEVTARCTGKLVEEKLTTITQQVGVPKQIVADRGSDIKKGIELYQEKNQTVIYTYDATH